jgi:hypothetical protein
MIVLFSAENKIGSSCHIFADFKLNVFDILWQFKEGIG